MSDDFDRLLREGSAQVAGSLTRPAPAALREHARRRVQRTRVVTGAFAACAVLVAGGALFGLEQSGGGTASVSGVSRASAASAPNPRAYVAGAWLGEGQLPYAGDITWQVNPQVLGTKLVSPVQLVLPGARTFFDSTVGGFGTYCSIPALANQAVAGQVESFYGPITGSHVPSTAGIPATATQSTVFYRNQSAATAAWDAIGGGFEACAKFETGRVSGESKTYPSLGTAKRIVSGPDAQCWTNLAAVSGSGPGVTDFLDDVCFVRHGTLIGSVDVGFEGPGALSGLDFSDVDARVVSQLQHALSAYDAR